ncbi:hypothetical protein GGF46_002178 [Coemansia sp. RSA 552]|nr:hypothetical protein GGF46_002178 [Coemansia sp. RSA 552]
MAFKNAAVFAVAAFVATGNAAPADLPDFDNLPTDVSELMAMTTDPAFQEAMKSLSDLANDPEFSSLLNDPNLLKSLTNGDFPTDILNGGGIHQSGGDDDDDKDKDEGGGAAGLKPVAAIAAVGLSVCAALF